ncbi:MAG: YebC/PmpR family DNA-binding transcriptional regulator [Rhodospirillaceae bacterium]|nr:MAG: YebC/PmpR family DNA-binding transcriptional regulator [Rhodospirillaceae bacterium]
MAGHSKFKNIQYRKGAQDAKRAKLFTKIIRELTVATRAGGGDLDGNPRLRTAVMTARAANLPKDTLERAIRRGAGDDDGVNYEEIRYEGYGPGGAALIVEALTDNRNRSAAEIRTAFNKHGGSLGEINSVLFQFERVGMLQYPVDKVAEAVLFEAALEAGAENVETDATLHEVTCAPDDFNAVREALEKTFGAPDSAALVWKPKTTAPVSDDDVETLFRLIEVLEDNDDVQTVSANYEISDAALAKLSA